MSYTQRSVITQIARGAALAGAAVLALAGCGKHSKPNFIYMPDMVYSPAFKAQEEGANRVPPKGTVPRGFNTYGYEVEGSETTYAYQNEDEAGKALKNPLKRTKAVLLRGQRVFNYSCITCHGGTGEGGAAVTTHGYPPPPTLQSDRVRGWPDGSIFHLITKGRGLMPSYASMIPAQDRWAVIHYIRALQRSKHPTPEDLKAFEASTQ